MIWDQCPEPEVRANAQRAPSRTSGSKGHWNHRLASVALVRKFASEQAENSGELPNRDTSLLELHRGGAGTGHFHGGEAGRGQAVAAAVLVIGELELGVA